MSLVLHTGNITEYQNVDLFADIKIGTKELVSYTLKSISQFPEVSTPRVKLNTEIIDTIPTTITYDELVAKYTTTKTNPKTTQLVTPAKEYKSKVIIPNSGQKKILIPIKKTIVPIKQTSPKEETE